MSNGIVRMVGVGVVSVALWAGLGGVRAAHGQVSAATAASGKRPMAFADLMAMKRVSDPQISPSGKWVMFSVTDVSLEKNTKTNHLWVVPLSGGREMQATFGDGESNGRFSPDGKWVSLTMKNQIYLAPWDEAASKIGAAVELTHVAGGADGAIWAPNSKRLMFVADVYPACSATSGMDATWAEEDACDKEKDDAAAASPVKGQVWDALLYRHWDHYTGEKRSHVLIVSATDGASGNTVRDLTPRSAVGDAETPTWTLDGPIGYAWAPDSEEIAYVTNLDKVPAASTNNDVFTLRLDEPGAKAVKVSTSPGSDDAPAYSPDGKWLAFRSQARAGFESDLIRLMLFDRETKTIRELMPKFDRWVDEFVWAPDSKTIYVASGMSGAANIFRYSFVDKTLTIQTRGVRGFEASEDSSMFRSENDLGEYSDIRVSPDGNLLIAGMVSVRAPTELVSLKVEDREEGDDTGQRVPRRSSDGSESTIRNVLLAESRITHINDRTLTALDVPKMESFWFTGAEGTKVEGFILRPPGFDRAKKYPVKFLMHGGPQTAWGDSWSYRWNWELMAANGYVVIGINRRGSTGYGQKFVDEVSGDWGGRAYVDLMKGLDYAEAKFPFIDKTRECALGASYGGYMADWVLTHTNRFKCIVTHDGMYDAESAYGDTEEMWFNEWEFRRPEDFPKGWDGFPSQRAKLAGDPGFEGGGGTGKANTEILTGGQNDGRRGVGHPAEPWRYASLPVAEDPFRKWSPMLSIQNAKTPTLVIHSQKDYRLDVSQGIALFTALQRLGVPSRMLYFPDEGHWVLKPQNSELWYETVGDWCDKWTQTGKYAEMK